jgi:hypothetical protein
VENDKRENLLFQPRLKMMIFSPRFFFVPVCNRDCRGLQTGTNKGFSTSASYIELSFKAFLFNEDLFDLILVGLRFNC